VLGRIDRLDDEDFTEYNVSLEHVIALRQRVKDWRTSLAACSGKNQGRDPRLRWSRP